MLGLTAWVVLIGVEAAMPERDAAPAALLAPRSASEKQVQTDPEAAPGEYLDFEGHDREWWRERLRSLQAERSGILDNIADARERLNTIPLNIPDSGKRMMRFEIREELKGYNKQLQNIERKIKIDLLEEARKAGAPPGWLR